MTRSVRRPGAGYGAALSPPGRLTERATRAELRRDLERLEFQVRMLRGKLAKRPPEPRRRCAFCGAPTGGYACEWHTDLPPLDALAPRRDAA